MNDAPTSVYPKLSIVIATYNAVNSIRRCLRSIGAQTYKNVEVVVVDGQSTDGTVDAVEANRNLVTKFISEPDTGIFNAWNKGWKVTTGEWIGFLGADDVLWKKDVLAHLAAELRRVSTRVRVAYGRVALLDPNGVVLEVLGAPWHETVSALRCRMSIPHTGTWCRRSAFESRGGFDESFRIAGDYEFVLRQLSDGEAHFIDGPWLVGMQVGGTSSRSRHILIALRENDRAQAIHGLRRRPLVRAWAYFKAYIRLTGSWVVGEDKVDRLVDRMRRIRARFRRAREAQNP